METIILSITAVIVLWYTFETRLLRKSTQRQTEVAVQPFLVVEHDNETAAVVIVNKGRGIARHIKFSLSDTDKGLDFVNIDSLCEGEKREISVRVNQNIRRRFRNEDLRNWLVIRYENMFGLCYSQRCRRADYGDGFTAEDRDVSEPMPQWVYERFAKKS